MEIPLGQPCLYHHLWNTPSIIVSISGFLQSEFLSDFLKFELYFVNTIDGVFSDSNNSGLLT